MNYQDTVSEIKKITLAVLEPEGVELVDLIFSVTRGGALLRLLVDRKEGGISIQDCARLNEEIGKILDTQDIINTRYTLEVSSPGLDRPLKKASDFSRCLNRAVRVWFYEPIMEKSELAGLVKEVKLESITLETEDKTIEIPLEKISRAKQIIGNK